MVWKVSMEVSILEKRNLGSFEFFKIQKVYIYLILEC